MESLGVPRVKANLLLEQQIFSAQRKNAQYTESISYLFLVCKQSDERQVCSLCLVDIHMGTARKTICALIC